ncbi:hypothetical protein PMNALOAF_1233 [Methylobacterium adhaesivum]|nr:hypothetical protein PMNALOAF_1233 [Methylobacterium adhaesivum]
MIRALTLALIGIGALLIALGTADARNTPCSQGKGGIKACQNGKFLCQDGSISASKKKCSR